MAAREYQHPAAAELSLPRVLFALSEPLRLSMLVRLAAGGEVDSIELGPDLPRSTLTHHTTLLRDAGLVFTRPDGRKCFMSLRTDDIESRFPGLLPTILAAAVN